jgi:hypothetical protein
MPKFKVGDRIRCLETGRNVHITVGKIYKVLEIKAGGWVYIKQNQENYTQYNPDYFELVRRERNLPLWW